MKKERVISWVIFIALSLVWGSSFILMKKTAEELNGWEIGSIRIFSAGLFFLPLAIIHLKDIPKDKLLLVLLSGVIGNFFPSFLFAISISKKVDSSFAGILNSLTPLFVVALGIMFFKVKIENKKIAGVIIGFIGLFILTITRGPISISSIGFTLLILLATIFYGINVNMVGKFLKGVDPFKMATVSISFIAIPATIILSQQEVIQLLGSNETKRTAFFLVCLLGIFGTAIATAFFYLLIKRAGGLFASLVTYAIPVVAIFWGILANEPIGIVQFGCLGIILTGVYLANKSENKNI